MAHTEHPDGVHSEDYAARTHELESMLVGKGHITTEEIEAQIENRDSAHPGRGARIVARAWVDPEYRELLLSDAKAAAGELGIDTSAIVKLDVLENTPTRHHVVVCTLCSCYPRAILGEPPMWYKSEAYRGRVIREPREVLAEFGLSLPGEVQIVVVDSTADQRFLVLPTPPEDSEGLSEEDLAELVTRDSMIGVGHPLSPSVR